MLIGIISDSHDNIWNLEKVIRKLREHKVEAVIHCGDLCAPFIVAELEKIGVPVHVVFGNIDDRQMTPELCEKSDLVQHYGELAELMLGDKKIAVTHLPNNAESLANSGKYDIVFHGHTHLKRNELIKKTLLVNPGEIMGRLGKPSYAIYDTEKNSIEAYDF